MTWLERVCDVHEHSVRPAVIDQTGVVTGRDLIGKAAYAAELLCALDTPKGWPIPALLRNTADALALLLAGAATDRPIAPLNPRQTTVELSDALRGIGSAVLLVERPFEGAARSAARSIDARMVTIPQLDISSCGLWSDPGHAALYIHTAGTTGVPKRVPFTDAVLGARADVLGPLIGLSPDHRYATGSPLHHVGGLGNILGALTTGAAVISTPTFSAQWWCSLRALGATHCLLVPTMIEMLLADGLLDSVPLRTLIYGAAPITVDTLRRVLTRLPEVGLVNLYGQTEGSPITSLGPKDHRRAADGNPELLRTVGRGVDGLRLLIDEPDESGVGEVLAAAEHLSAPGPDGWLHTGDLGVVDDHGYLRLCGRRHDMVVRGGENVYPLEVENVLTAHPTVAAAGVVGVPDPRLGETLAAFVVPADPAHPPRDEELRSFVREALSGFKTPQYWYLVTELPLNSAGKVIRGPLRESHADRQK